MNQETRTRLLRRLLWQAHAHDSVRDSRNLLPILPDLRRWQSVRLASGFADFLADPGTRPAAEFFLTDLYGDKDFSARDRDAARVLPAMSRLLPESLLRAAADAIELALISHALDLRVAQALARRKDPGARISPEDYANAYRDAGCPRLRKRQIALILEVGHALDAAVRKHGVGRLLRAARLPAKLAGLSELQGFLERGFTAFAELGDARAFLAEIGRRESLVSERLFSGGTVRP